MHEEVTYDFPAGDFAKKLTWSEEQQMTQLFVLTEKNRLEIFTAAGSSLQRCRTLQQETVIYDVSVLKGASLSPSYLASCKDMPIRLYDIATHSCLGSIADRKENSEVFLSPLVLRQSHESPHQCFGAGLKFLSNYDLNRCARAFRFKQFDKKHLSALDVQPQAGEKLLAVGEFTGEMHVVSPADNSVLLTVKCHVDGITDLKFLANNPTMLLSSARYDDFKYLWDLRMTGRFVSCYHLPNSSNQRTNLELSADCSTFMTGSQAGELWIFPIDSSEKPVSWRLFNQSLNWVERAQNGNLAVSSGQRHFGEEPRAGGTMQVRKGSYDIFRCSRQP